MKEFFKGISVSQLSAGALAAVTSFLLSAKIGIAGSVIGVAVGSVVSAAASQIYKNIIHASSEKLQVAAGKAPQDDANGADDDRDMHIGSDDAAAQTNDATEKATNDATQATTHTPRLVSSSGQTAGSYDAAQETTDRSDSTGMMRAPRRAGSSGMKSLPAADRRTDPATRHTTDATKRTKRIAIVVAVASALAAVGITAGVILAFTNGQGTDSVVRDLVNQQTVQHPETPHPSNPLPEDNNTNGNDPSNPNDDTAHDGTTDNNAATDGKDGSNSEGTTGSTLGGQSPSGGNGTNTDGTGTGNSGAGSSGTGDANSTQPDDTSGSNGSGTNNMPGQTESHGSTGVSGTSSSNASAGTGAIS